jgi:hypothetical protein
MPDLGDVRSQFNDELQNPAVYNKLIASIEAEVGGQSPTAKLAYIESVMNRAAARNMTIDQTISSAAPKGYYPPSTISKLGKTYGDDIVSQNSPLISQALGGSNISNFATGNESGKVYSAGAPHTLSTGPKPGDERFVLENPDLAWGQKQGAQVIPAGTGMTVVPPLASTTTTPASPAPVLASTQGPSIDPVTAQKIQEMNMLVALAKRNNTQ